jgi:hypothetical protein
MTTAHFSDGTFLITRGNASLQDISLIYNRAVYSTSMADKSKKQPLTLKERVELINAKSEQKISQNRDGFTEKRLELMGFIANCIVPNWNVKFTPLKY